jgi:hypothetical protein
MDSVGSKTLVTEEDGKHSGITRVPTSSWSPESGVRSPPLPPQQKNNVEQRYGRTGRDACSTVGAMFGFFRAELIDFFQGKTVENGSYKENSAVRFEFFAADSILYIVHLLEQQSFRFTRTP